MALSGDAVAPASCTDGTEPTCLDTSGAIDRITPWGQVTTLVSGLPSVSSGGPGASATGPAEGAFIDGHLDVLFQNTDIDPTTGNESYGTGGSLLGDLVNFPHFGGTASVDVAFGPFEAANNPDGGEGTAVQLGAESAIDSDPYSFVPYHGGFAVADAAANDLLFVSRSGKISVPGGPPHDLRDCPTGHPRPHPDDPGVRRRPARPRLGDRGARRGAVRG